MDIIVVCWSIDEDTILDPQLYRTLLQNYLLENSDEISVYCLHCGSRYVGEMIECSECRRWICSPCIRHMHKKKICEIVKLLYNCILCSNFTIF